MARKPTTKEPEEQAARARTPRIQRFSIWVVGDTPLICHAWSQKGKGKMLRNQQQEINPDGVEARDPQEDFLNSLYRIGESEYGFPVTGLKRAFVDTAHKDRGIIREDIKTGLWLDHKIIRVGPALAGAVCDLPLIPLVCGEPEMREDMVRIGQGLRKTANLAYRAQFFPWAINVTGRMNASIISNEALISLVLWAGLERGIGDWRNEKNGMMGAFHPAEEGEIKQWERFRDGKGPIPMPPNYYKDAA